MFNVNEIKSNLKFDGARPSLFEVILRNPVSTTGDEKLRFMVKAASIPASEITPIQVPYFGRKINVAGTRTYQPWQIQVINDEDFTVRTAFEAWHSRINSSQGNVRSLGGTDYRAEATVRQYNKEGAVIREYSFVNAWPTEVGPIELAWENGDAIEEFSVTLVYDYWLVNNSEVVV